MATLHRGARASHCRSLSLRSTGSRRAGSVVVAHGLSCSASCGIFPDQGSNPCPLHRQANSQPLCHQGSPYTRISFTKFILQYYTIQGWFNLRMQNGGYGGLSKVIRGFLIVRRLTSPAPELFKGQLYINIPQDWQWYVLLVIGCPGLMRLESPNGCLSGDIQ